MQDRLSTGTPPAEGATQRLSQFLARTSFRDIPADVIVEVSELRPEQFA